MSKITHTRTSTSESTPATGAPMAGTRIDAAHVLGDGPAAPAAAAVAPLSAQSAAAAPAIAPDESVSLVWTEDLLSRLRVQGRQLADRLRERQRELDRRAANSHAQTAEFENEVRAARLWLIERQQELADREAQLADRASRLSAAETYHESARKEHAAETQRREAALARREQEVADESARVARQTAALAGAQREVEARRQREHQSLVEQRQQLDRRRQSTLDMIRLALAGVEQRRTAVEEQAAALDRDRQAAAAVAARPSQDQQRYARELQLIAERLTAREAALDECERLQARAEAERDALRLQLEEEAERLQAQARIDRRRLVDERRASDLLATRQQEAMRQKQQQLDERQHALDRLRDELAVLHREALETRAAAEEALARLAGPDSVAHGALTQALNETRQKLSEQWRQAASQGATERAELAAVAQEIASQLQKLRQQKAELDEWIQVRERDFAQQAAALIAREEQLRVGEDQLRDQRTAWSRDRDALERRLRKEIADLTRWSQTSDCPP